MEKPLKTLSGVTKKRKRKAKATASENKAMKLDAPKPSVDTHNVALQKILMPSTMGEGMQMDEIQERYPIFKNEELVKRFLSVPMTNNQKGRIRQLLKDNLQGTTSVLLPDVINHKMQTILKSSEDLTDSDLRKLRILYNMLKTAVKIEKVKPKSTKKPATSVKPKIKGEVIEHDDAKLDKKSKTVNKVKGPKRYVVFLGNLPLDIDREKIIRHFNDISDRILDVRLPPPRSEKKSAIAYLELSDEPSFEIALSRHHSMLGTKRINVLYTTQKKSKVSKAEAKSKSAKLIALQMSGKLVGSTPLARRRSQRRKKLREARAKEAKDA